MAYQSTATIFHFQLPTWKKSFDEKLAHQIYEFFEKKIPICIFIQILSFIDLSLFEIFSFQKKSDYFKTTIKNIKGIEFFEDIRQLLLPQVSYRKVIKIDIPGYIKSDIKRSISKRIICVSKKILILPPDICPLNIPYCYVPQKFEKNQKSLKIFDDKYNCHFKYINLNILGRLERSPIKNLTFQFCRITLDNVFVNSGCLFAKCFTKVTIFNSIIRDSKIVCDPNSTIKIHNSKIINTIFLCNSSYRNHYKYNKVITLKLCYLLNIQSQINIKIFNCHFMQTSSKRLNSFYINGKNSLPIIRINRYFCFSKDLKFKEKNSESYYVFDYSFLDVSISKQFKHSSSITEYDPRNNLGRNFFHSYDNICYFSVFFATVLPKDIFIKCFKEQLNIAYLMLQNARILDIRALSTSFYDLIRCYFVTNFLYGTLEFDIEIPDIFKNLNNTVSRKEYHNNIGFIYKILLNLQEDLEITFLQNIRQRNSILFRINFNSYQMKYKFNNKVPIIDTYKFRHFINGIGTIYDCSNKYYRNKAHEKEMFIHKQVQIDHTKINQKQKLEIDHRTQNKDYTFIHSNKKPRPIKRARYPQTFIRKNHPKKFNWIRIE